MLRAYLEYGQHLGSARQNFHHLSCNSFFGSVSGLLNLKLNLMPTTNGTNFLCRAWKDVIFWVKKENDKPDSSGKHYHESFLRRTLALHQ
ncbi:hypothetical protein SLEP1_g23492 [Rubroshorea leprosula]|uniref:Uncharacterized protein n=1 Tax=Rubroshorea leprosula TaxID=152421 RepID=A0AAV5JJS2_9ROSI|nr:hypothetical protein SLEP1_g23492 [Rubroshorea leprosula]